MLHWQHLYKWERVLTKTEFIKSFIQWCPETIQKYYFEASMTYWDELTFPKNQPRVRIRSTGILFLIRPNYNKDATPWRGVITCVPQRIKELNWDSLSEPRRFECRDQTKSNLLVLQVGNIATQLV